MATERYIGVVALSLTLSLAGCAAILGFEDTTVVVDLTDGGDTDGEPPGDDSDGGEAGAGRITANPSSIVLRRGTSTQVAVDLQRGTDITGAVTVTFTDLPAGVTVTPAQLADGVSTGNVTLAAAKNAALGPATIHLGLTPPAFAPTSVSLLVSDTPGALDVTFDADGIYLDSTKGLAATFYALAPQTDGKLLAGGQSQPQGWMMRRLGPAGAPDSTFSALGMPNDGELRAITFDAAGNVVAVGSSTNGIFQELTVVRLGPTGTIDPKFATNGIFRLSNLDAPGGSNGYAVAIQPDGMILAAGSIKVAGGEDGIVVRVKTDGTKDTTFGTAGIATVKKNHFVGVSVAPGNTVALAGTDNTLATPTFFVGRRTSTGAADATFGTAGGTSFGTTFRANGFAQLPDGSLAVVGDAQTANQYTAGVASATGGMQWVRAEAIVTNASLFAAAAQADGAIIAAGSSTGPAAEARVFRFAANNGALDTTFGTNGSAILAQRPGSAFDVTLVAAAIQPDGRIVVSGNRSSAGACIFRLWP
jgi:uncharacterized delta-60 repeat protein